MKRKFCALLLLCALGLTLLPLIPQAAAVTEAGITTLYIEPNQEAGLSHRIYPVRSADDRLTRYLPGDVDAEKLCLSWADTTQVAVNTVAQTSGQLPVPQPGADLVIQVGRKYLRLRTLQGSAQVRAMHLTIDTDAQGFVSFQEMSADTPKEKKSAGTVTLGGETYHMSIKGRGNSTWTAYEKKPYNITLYKDGTYSKKQSTELIDGVSAKTWSLLANYSDGSLLRNKLGYALACALGIGLESDFIDLYVDGVYQGCYLMTPKSDYQAPDEGLMLEIDNYLDDEDPQITLEGMKEYHPDRYGFQHRFTVKENNTTSSTEDIRQYLQSAWDALRSHDSQEYLNYIDLDSWAKYYLLHEFYKSFDVICGSILMTRSSLAEGDKLVAGPVWDLDNSLGRTNDNRDLGLTPEQQHSPEGWYIQNVYDPEPWEGGDLVNEFWLQQLGKHPDFMARVYELYLQYQQVFDGAAALLQEEADRLDASARMNEDLIGFHSGASLAEPDDHGCVATHSWADFAANLKNYAEKRAAFLRNNIPGAQLPQEDTTQPAPSAPVPTTPSADAEKEMAPAYLIPVLVGCFVPFIAVFLALRKRKSAE